MKKKLLTILLSVFMIATAFTTSVLAEETFNVDGVNYLVKSPVESYTVEVIHDNSYTGDIVIPEKVVHNSIEYTVTSINKNAFSTTKTSITSVTIPSTVTSINDDTFDDCSNLASVTLHEGLTNIGMNAFSDTALTSITIPSTVTNIGVSAFYDCSNLATVICNAINPPSLGSQAFNYCNSNLKILVPEVSVATYKSNWSDYENKIEAIPMTVADILPANFPTSADNAWINNKNVKAYSMSNTIYFVKDTYLISIPYEAELTKSDNDYVLYNCVSNVIQKDITFNATFKITNNSFTQIEIDVTDDKDPDANDAEGVYTAPKTIANILPQDFPSTTTDDAPEDAWVNKYGVKAYINKEGILYFGSLPLNPSKNDVLTKVGNNYQISEGMCKISFNMESSNLKSITYLYASTTFEYSPYTFVNEENQATSGSTGDLEFKTYADYQNTPSNVTVKVQLEGDATPTTLTYDTHYTLQPGSTIVKLKGDYVKTLPVGTHTISIVVTGYKEVSQNFIITAAPTPNSDPTPRYKIPNTGVEGTTNNHSLLKLSSLSLLVIGTYMVLKKKKDN